MSTPDAAGRGGPELGTSVPAISVVIPTRNRRPLLQQAVESVLAQTVSDWELVIVDDASEDDTCEWLRTLRDPRIRVMYRDRHSEQSTTRNAGVRAARGPVTLSFDDDDLLPARALEIHLAALARYPDAIASIGGFTAFDEGGARRAHKVVRRRQAKIIWRDVLFGWIAVAGQCAFRTQALADVGWWDESFIRATDHELWSRLSRRGPVALLSETVLTYRVHSGQWRPTSLDQLMTSARRRAVDQLEGAEREQGERILEARALAEEAFHLFLEARAGASLRRYGRLLVGMPQLVRSPLTRPMVLNPMVRCVAGSWGIRTGRRALTWLDTRRRRRLDFSVRTTVESDGRVHAEPVRPATPVSPDLKRRLLKARLGKLGMSSTPISDIRPRDPSEPVPLSFSQEGIWFIEHLHQGRAVYDIPCTVRLQGDLDTEALRRALTEIVTRHEALRTKIRVDAEGRPWQHYRAPSEVDLPVHDLTSMPEDEREPVLRVRVETAMQRPFDLVEASLFKASLFVLGARTHVLVLQVHHLVCDGWSMGVFTRELASLYEAFQVGRPSPLRPPPIQYGDYALWERSALTGKRLERHLEFWRARLGFAPPTLQLPTDTPRSVTQSFRGAHHPITFGAALSGKVREVASRSSVTPFHTLLAAFDLFLHGLTREEQIVVGTTFANRGQTDVESSIGYFVNMLPFPVNLSGNPTFGAIQRQVRETALAIAEHQELPLAKLVTELDPDRDVAQHPYFQTVFYYLTPDHNPAVYGFGISSVEQTMTVGQLTLSPVDIECGLSRFDLAVLVWDLPDGMRGVVEYSTDLFAPITIQHWADRFLTVLRCALERPGASLQELVQQAGEDDRYREDARAAVLHSAALKRLANVQPR